MLFHLDENAWHCALESARVDVCYLKLVSFWLLLNHNTGIVAQSITHIHTRTKTSCRRKHTLVHTWVLTRAFVHSCMHLDTDALGHSCTCPHTYASCGICYYTILQVMNQPICLQSASKWEREKATLQHYCCSMRLCKCNLLSLFRPMHQISLRLWDCPVCKALKWNVS